MSDITDKPSRITVRGLHIREKAEGDGTTVEGVAVPFGEEYRLFGEYREVFDPDTDFGDTSRVKLSREHGDLIGRVTGTDVQDDGLHITAVISDTTAGRETAQLVRDGVYDSFSVGFDPVETVNEERDGLTILHRRKIDLREVAVCGTPAYKGAVITKQRTDTPDDDTTTTTTIGKEQDMTQLTELTERLDNLETETRSALSGLHDELANHTPATPTRIPFASQADMLKALVSGDDGRAEAARTAYRQLVTRDYTGATIADTDTQPTWIADRIRILQQKRTVANLLAHEALPAEGMSLSYLVLDTDTTTVKQQAKEGDYLPYGKIAFTERSANIATYGGYGDLSRQVIERATSPYLNTYMSALTAAYARATENAARVAFYGAINNVADADKLTVGKTVDALTPNDWVDLIIDAAGRFDDVNATLDYIGVSEDVFKLIAHLTDTGDRFMDVSGQGATTLGSLDPAATTGRLLRRDVYLLDGAPAGTVVFMDKTAVTMWESGGAPFQLQADNAINLTRQFSVYGYAAFGVTFPQGITPVKFATK